MSHKLICAWLGLPAGVWPPDHYRLLGLPPGENDPNLIEERVHQRLDAVRRYQMTHPEQATEAMNRIAQAFVCLSEPVSKRVYDANVLGIAVPVEEPLSGTNSNGEPLDALTGTVVEDREPLVLVYNPSGQEQAPPIRLAGDVPIPGADALPDAEVAPTPIIELGALHPAAQKLAAKRQLYQSIVRTRALIDLWNQAGKYVATPTKRLSKLSDVNELMSVLRDICEKLKAFPTAFGQSGQPGYLVIALAQLSSMPMFQTLDPSQREAISHDWEAGLKTLLSHSAYLRDQAQAYHKRGVRQRLTRSVRNLLLEKPGYILFVLAFLAFSVAIGRTWVYSLLSRVP